MVPSMSGTILKKPKRLAAFESSFIFSSIPFVPMISGRMPEPSISLTIEILAGIYLLPYTLFIPATVGDLTFCGIEIITKYYGRVLLYRRRKARVVISCRQKACLPRSLL